MQWLYPAVGVYAGSLIFFLLKKERTSIMLLTAGFVPYTAGIIVRGWYLGVFTPVNFFTEQFFLPWCLAALTICLCIRSKDSRTPLTLLFPSVFFL